MDRVFIGKAPIDVIGAVEAAQWVLDRVHRGIRTRIAPVNSAIVVAARTQPSFAETLESFDLLLADGFWPAFSATLLFRTKVPHTNTSPFLRALFQQCGPAGMKVFLLGARPEVVAIAASNLTRFHPNAIVVGYENGYFDPDDASHFIDLINASGATALFVGISSPKKELFIERHWSKLNVLLSVGVGGQFDIWGGQTREAPDWVRKWGLEWFFRLIQEPNRLLKRYTIENIRFVLIVLGQAVQMLMNRTR